MDPAALELPLAEDPDPDPDPELPLPLLPPWLLTAGPPPLKPGTRATSLDADGDAEVVLVPDADELALGKSLLGSVPDPRSDFKTVFSSVVATEKLSPDGEVYIYDVFPVTLAPDGAG